MWDVNDGGEDERRYGDYMKYSVEWNSIAQVAYIHNIAKSNEIACERLISMIWMANLDSICFLDWLNRVLGNEVIRHFILK